MIIHECAWERSAPIVFVHSVFTLFHLLPVPLAHSQVDLPLVRERNNELERTNVFPSTLSPAQIEDNSPLKSNLLHFFVFFLFPFLVSNFFCSLRSFIFCYSPFLCSLTVFSITTVLYLEREGECSLWCQPFRFILHHSSFSTHSVLIMRN